VHGRNFWKISNFNSQGSFSKVKGKVYNTCVQNVLVYVWSVLVYGKVKDERNWMDVISDWGWNC